MSSQIVSIQSAPVVRRRGERGMTTAEYAVGVIAVIAAVGVLIAVFAGGPFSAAVNDLVLQLVHSISGQVK